MGCSKLSETRIYVSITKVIVFATAVSTIVAVGSGLVLYFDSLQGLTDTIKEVSEADLSKLVAEIRLSFTDCIETANVMEGYFKANNDIINVRGSDAENAQDWSSLIRWLEFHNIKQSKTVFEIGIILIPHEESDPNLQYVHIWYDQLANRSREYVYARYGAELQDKYYTPPENTTGNDYHFALTDAVHSSTGNVLKYAYNFSVTKYWRLVDGWDMNSMDSPDGWVGGPLPARASRWRPPQPWYASDENPFVFMAYDTVHVPPPPPHPWSKYRAVMFQGYYMFSSWEDAINKYSSTSNDGTQIILMDGSTETVYAATTGESMISKGCFKAQRAAALDDPLVCVTKIFDMSSTVQDAWEDVKGRSSEDDVFIKGSFGGSTKFLRRMKIFEFTPEVGNTTINAVILWLRPLSAVEDKLQRALTIFLVFTSAVFILEVVSALVEIFLVALPLKRISLAIQDMGTLDLESSTHHMELIKSYVVQLSEINGVMEGVNHTLSALRGYRTYIPQSVLDDEELDSNVIPPKGDVTIVFTDIRESTDLWEKCPDAMDSALSIHSRVIRQAIRKHGGYEVKTIGDAFMVAFDSPISSVNFAMSVQEGLLDAIWPSEFQSIPLTKRYESDGKMIWNGLRLRIGAHYGPVTLDINPITQRADYRGPTVNKASRIENAAMEGVLVLSKELLSKVEDCCSGITVRFYASKPLKGIGTSDLYLATSDRLSNREATAVSVSERSRSAVPKRPKSDCSAGSVPVTITNQKLSRQLNNVRGAVANINMKAVVKAVEEGVELAYVLFLTNTTIQAIVDSLLRTEGKVEGLLGNYIVGTWNIISSCNNFMVQSIRCCGLVDSRVDIAKIGISCGTFTHGNVGTSNRRFHTVMGVCYSQAVMLSNWEKISSKYLAVSKLQFPDAVKTALTPAAKWTLPTGSYIILYDISGPNALTVEIGWDFGHENNVTITGDETHEVEAELISFPYPLTHSETVKMEGDVQLTPVEEVTLSIPVVTQER